MLTLRRDAGDSQRHFIRGKAGGRGINCMEEDSLESSQLNRARKEGGLHAEPRGSRTRDPGAPEPETPGRKLQGLDQGTNKDNRGNSKP